MGMNNQVTGHGSRHGCHGRTEERVSSSRPLVLRLPSELRELQPRVHVDEVDLRLLLLAGRAALLVQRGPLDLPKCALDSSRANRTSQQRHV